MFALLFHARTRLVALPSSISDARAGKLVMKPLASSRNVSRPPHECGGLLHEDPDVGTRLPPARKPIRPGTQPRISDRLEELDPRGEIRL